MYVVASWKQRALGMLSQHYQCQRLSRPWWAKECAVQDGSSGQDEASRCCRMVVQKYIHMYFGPVVLVVVPKCPVMLTDNRIKQYVT